MRAVTINELEQIAGGLAVTHGRKAQAGLVQLPPVSVTAPPLPSGGFPGIPGAPGLGGVSGGGGGGGGGASGGSGGGGSNPAIAANDWLVSDFGIDLQFLFDHESSNPLQIAVPNTDGDVDGHSGITIGYGYDLGGADIDAELQAWVDQGVISQDFYNEIKDWVGLTGAGALQYFNSHELGSNPFDSKYKDDLTNISKMKYSEILHRVNQNFYEDSGVHLSSLPYEVKTAISDVAIQYGSLEPDDKCPQFWGDITHFDWEGAVDELRNFGDDYDTRRNDDASEFESGVEKYNLVEYTPNPNWK